VRQLGLFSGGRNEEFNAFYLSPRAMGKAVRERLDARHDFDDQ
jgi:hypothetical protein